MRTRSKLFWVGVALILVGFWLFVPVTLLAFIEPLSREYFYKVAIGYFICAVTALTGWLFVEYAENKDMGV